MTAILNAFFRVFGAGLVLVSLFAIHPALISALIGYLVFGCSIKEVEE